MNALRNALSGVAVSATLLAAQQAAPAAIQKQFALVRPAFSGDRALQTVAFMDKYFRLPGNTGFDASIRRVATILDGAGFVEQSKAAPSARLTYRIEKRPLVRPTWEPEDATVTIVGERAPLLKYATNRNMVAINSYSTPPAGVEAELVFVGEGSAAEIQAANVAGKIVFGNAPSSRLFTEAVQRQGAIGVLGYSMEDYTKPAVNQKSIRFSSIALDSAQQSWGINLSYGARERLRAALARGPVRLRVMTRTRIYAAEELTLVADVRGDRVPNERFVFSAHVQEPGANDNASGVATQAEIARVLGGLVQRGKVSPARSITFIWGDEISATQRYLREDSVRLRDVHWGLSLDMVGENTKRTGGTFLIEKMPDPSAIWTRGEDKHTEWGGSPMRVEDMRPHYFNDFILNRCLEQAKVTRWVVKANPYEGGSDHTPFLNAGKPGLLLWHFTDVFYHTDGDRVRNVSPQTMKNVGIAALVSALTLTTADSTTAMSIVGEIQKAATTRLATEFALGNKAVADGGDRDRESLIIRTWAQWYASALESASDLEVGGPSEALSIRINEAAAKVEALGSSYMARVGRK